MGRRPTFPRPPRPDPHAGPLIGTVGSMGGVGVLQVVATVVAVVAAFAARGCGRRAMAGDDADARSGSRSLVARRVGWSSAAIVACLVLIVAAVPLPLALWTASGDRSPIAGLVLAEGVVYDRLVWDEPRPVVVHVVTVDPSVPGVGVEVTQPVSEPGEGAALMAAATTSTFVAESGVVVGINGSFFHPFEEYPPSRYPRVDDEVTALGWIVVDGEVHGRRWEGATFSVLADDRVVVGEVAPDARYAISGKRILLLDGAIPDDLADGATGPGLVGRPYARTVLAADARSGRWFLVVVDGKQAGYSEGLTLAEVARFLAEDLGATDAIELDGGGSATMAALDPAGSVTVLSRPINTRIPGRERIVASHLGIRACGPAACER